MARPTAMHRAVAAVADELGAEFVAEIGMQRIRSAVVALGLKPAEIVADVAPLAKSLRRAIEAAGAAAGQALDPRDPRGHLIGEVTREALWVEDCVDAIAVLPAGQALDRGVVRFTVAELRRGGMSVEDIRSYAGDIAVALRAAGG